MPTTATATITRPVPRDPRTPLQAAQEQLAAIHKHMRTGHLPRSARRQAADRIYDLETTIAALTPTA
jgi:hypothetical protein